MTIYSFIAWLLRSCGIWFLVYLEFVGLCHCLLLGFLLAGKVVLVTIVMEIYGWLFLIVWCGVFGRREIVGVLKTRSAPCLISSFFFSKPYLIGSLCGETIHFLLFWIYLIFVMFVFDLFTHVYFLCTWVSLSFLSMNLYYLSKKKNNNNKIRYYLWIGVVGCLTHFPHITKLLSPRFLVQRLLVYLNKWTFKIWFS